MIEKLLTQLGLGNKERVLYKLILEYGKIAPSLLSRLAKINRTTVYSVIKELKDKGLVIEDLGGKTLYYLPAKDDELERLIKIEHEKMAQKEKSIRELQEFIKQIPESQTFSIPKIRFIEEADLESYLQEATPRWYESMETTEKTWWGFQDHSFVEKFEKWIDWCWSKAPKDSDLKLLTNESDAEKNMKSKKYSDKRQVKWFGSNKFSVTQWIVGNYVIYIMTKQRPFYLVEIHDSVIAHNSRELFKSIWHNAH